MTLSIYTLHASFKSRKTDIENGPPIPITNFMPLSIFGSLVPFEICSQSYDRFILVSLPFKHGLTVPWLHFHACLPHIWALVWAVASLQYPLWRFAWPRGHGRPQTFPSECRVPSALGRPGSTASSLKPGHHSCGNSGVELRQLLSLKLSKITNLSSLRPM